ncbi:MAG: OsmC family protein [Nanoarchaeota archaeon]|nr:OsmC family protein [Nanoarchaeota archaeon]MBU1005739.1 OsmC family protein [Nanoarchaeota archaeon]MBU1945576.1 OsmC family protein [Nanoarchaeota archaeon]
MPSVNIVKKEDMLFETKVGNHSLEIDVPDTMGGKDRAMTPPQLLLVAMASCTAAFVAEYCKTAGIDSKDLKVTLNFEKTENQTMLTNFKMNVSLPNLPENKKQAVLRAASACPVHDSIKNFKGIDFVLV